MTKDESNELANSRRKDPFTRKEAKALFEAAAKMPGGEDWQTMILLGWCTGARLVDCAHLSWKDVRNLDGEEPFISLLAGKKQREGRRGTPKPIAIVEPLASHLRGIALKDGALCPTLHSLEANDLSPRFKKLMALAGIDRGKETAAGKGRNWYGKGFHSFRHGLASLLTNAGVLKEWAARMTDHESWHVDISALNREMRKADLTFLD